MRSPTSRIRCSMRYSSSQPHVYVSSRSRSMPLNERREQAVALAADGIARVRPPARTRRRGTRRARAYACGRRSRAASLRARASSGRRAASADEERLGLALAAPRRACSAHASAWRRAATTPRGDAFAQRRLEARESRRARARCARPRPPSRRRYRTPSGRSTAGSTCTGLPMMRSGRSSSPASCKRDREFEPVAHHARGEPVVVVVLRRGRERVERVARRGRVARAVPAGE